MELGWRPLHEGHSIAEMVLALDLDQAPDQPAMERIAGSKEKFPDLPGVNVGRGVPISPPLLPFPSSPQLPIVAVTFDCFTPAGMIAERLAVQGNVLSYNTTEYSGWETVSGNAFRNLAKLIDIAAPVRPTGASLRYMDKFIWVGQASDGSEVSHLIRQGSDLVSAKIFSSNGLSHSHIGFYERLPGGVALVNLNVDLVDEPGVGRVAYIITFARVALDAGVTPGEDGGRGVKSLLGATDEVHVLCKGLLRDLLTDPVSARIGLAGVS